MTDNVTILRVSRRPDGSRDVLIVPPECQVAVFVPRPSPAPAPAAEGDSIPEEL